MAKNKNKIHRHQVYEKSKYSCVYCGIEFKVPENWNTTEALHNGEMFLEIDHIKPLSKGGSDELQNKQALCQKCNKDVIIVVDNGSVKSSSKGSDEGSDTLSKLLNKETIKLLNNKTNCDIVNSNLKEWINNFKKKPKNEDKDFNFKKIF
ncbi:HNH endonuclease [Cellulophaga phage phi46:3]|uniref:HNH endonuclease n=1 Tax=Cellulophaga phage phi46:3 TaxID=1327985 RepID=S0A2Q5_9CAUD|nr:HNH endonuclease [Cellulophaga phage phi46:3]AGO48752.1 HNH endonuclease [Cellulophaga phage phi46:3]